MLSSSFPLLLILGVPSSELDLRKDPTFRMLEGFDFSSVILSVSISLFNTYFFVGWWIVIECFARDECFATLDIGKLSTKMLDLIELDLSFILRRLPPPDLR